MDLFKLLGTISINNDEANKSLDETGAKGEKAESKLGKVFGGIGKGALAVGKAVGTGMLVAGTAVAGLATKSIQAYADYEQLVGGVETLFKESADKVLQNANQAYKTAGLSANAYMETVTSFSASLLQSLGGDTAKAAEMADMAIIDMSDNANKMGTSMEMIQNAYNGFAKQNYTMLDNLKLGYGGTKEEMARLLKDAEKLSGQKFDLSSYADVVEAIHVIQTEMGITGTTAKEAASTISGSLGMMKASWQNVMTAISDENADFDSTVTAFVDSVGAVAENLMPRIEIALNGVVKLIDKLAPVIMAKVPELLSTLLPSIVQGATNLMNSLVAIIPGLVSTLTSLLPEIVGGFIAIIEGLFNGLEDLAWDAAPQLVNGIVNAIESLIGLLPLVLDRLLSALVGLAPSLITGIMSVASTLASELPGILEVFVEYIPWLLEEIAGALLDNLPMLINGLTTMITGIVEILPWVVNYFLGTATNILTMVMEQLPVILPTLIQAIMSLLTMLLEQIPVLLPMIVQAVMTIINLLVEQLPVLIPMIIDAVIQIIYLLIEQLPIIMPMLIEACITIIMAIVEALPTILTALTDALPGLLQAVWDAIVMIFENLPQWFGQIFDGAVEIIKELFSPITGWFSEKWEKIKEIFKPVTDFFDTIFGNAWQAVKSIWEGLSNLFSGIWQAVKVVMAPVDTWLKDKFEKAWEGIKKAFSAVGEFFSGIWEDIKTTFTDLGTKIGDAVSKAVRKGINALITSAENIINGFLKMINNAIGMINKVPGVSISKVKLVSFQKLAEGGVVDEPTPAVFGEDGAEAVVPLEKNTGWLTKVAKQLHEFSIKTKNDLEEMFFTRSVALQEQQVSEMQNLNNKVDTIINLLGLFFPEALEAMRTPMVLDPDGAAVALAAPMDRQLGIIAIQKGRGRR